LLVPDTDAFRFRLIKASAKELNATGHVSLADQVEEGEMIDRVNSIPTDQAKNRFYAVRSGKSYVGDAVGVYTDEAPRILFGVEEDWYDAFWYSNRPDGWPTRLGRELWNMLRTVRMEYSAPWRARQHERARVRTIARP
jgi:hypothetical protein